MDSGLKEQCLYYWNTFDRWLDLFKKLAKLKMRKIGITSNVQKERKGQKKRVKPLMHWGKQKIRLKSNPNIIYTVIVVMIMMMVTMLIMKMMRKSLRTLQHRHQIRMRM